MRRSFLVVFFTQPVIILAWYLANDVDFEFCLKVISNQSTLNRSDRSDTTNQVFPLDPKTGAQQFANRTLLTLSACEHFCHGGFELWPLNEILSRVVLWVVPAVVLVTRFHFAPLSGSNTFRVILHLLGDPIDSIWSMLIRQEANRRLIMRMNFNKTVIGAWMEIATIWAAYDEICWINPAQTFEDAFYSRYNTNLRATQSSPTHFNQPTTEPEHNQDLDSSQSLIPRNPQRHSRVIPEKKDDKLDEFEKYYIMLAAQRITSNRSESKLTTFVAILGLLAALAGAFIRTWSNQLNNQTSHTIAVVSLFFIFIPIVWISSNIGAFTSPTVVIEIIQELRRNLKEHNDELKRDIEEYNDELQRKMENSSDELRRNLEKLNSGEPNDELQQSLTERNIELQCNLKEWNNELQRNSKTKAYLYSRQDLFPPLSLGKEFGWNGKEIDVVHKANESKFWHGLVTHIPFLGKLLSKHMSPTDSSASLIPGEESTNREVSEETQNLVMWPIVGAYLGMNSCWRPDKSLESTLESEHAGRSKLTLLVFPFVFVWGCSYVPALLLSYFTPLVGFACRSLAWTIIVGLWTLAPVLSLMFQAYVKSAKWLWFWTTVIDAINSLAIILIVFLAQVGVFNSCYCRSGALTGMTGDENYINLYPPTDEEFLASLWKWGIIPAVALIIMGSFLAIAGSGSYSAQALLNRDTSEKSGDTSAINQGRENLRFDKKSRCWQSIQQLGTSETTSTQQFIERPRGQNAQDQDGEDIEMGTISSYTDGALPY